MSLPFKEKKINKSSVIREFSGDVKEDELVWHRDKENRKVVVLESNGWQLQMDNCLPVLLETGNVYSIPKESYHRIIKGDGSLRVKIIKEHTIKITDSRLRKMISEELSSANELMYADTSSLQAPVTADMFNEDYITRVLGIEIPLHESHPYSPDLQRKILQEHILLEGFFDDFKKLGGDSKNAALALRYIMQDGSRVEQYAGLVKKDLQESYENIKKFLDEVISSLKALPEKVVEKMKKLLEWAEGVLEKIQSLAKAALGASGWKGAMIVSGAVVGIGFLWSKLKDSAPQVLDGLKKVKDFLSKFKKESAILSGASIMEAYAASEEELSLIMEGPDVKELMQKVKDAVKPLMDDIKKMGPKALKGLAVEALTGALTGGVASAFNALKSIFGGAKLVFQFLGKPLEKFVGQIKNPEAEAKEAEKGEDDPTVKEGRYLKFTSTQVRFLTEASELEEAKNTCWDGYSPGAKSGKKTKKGKGGKRVPNCELQEDDESDSTIKYNGNKALKGDQTKLPDKLQKGIIDKRLEEDDTPHEKQYDAPQGSKRDKQLDQTKADLKSGDPERVERAYRRRERMERSEREKNESTIRALIEEFMKEALSKKTKATLRKKAEERGLTVGSVEKEYKKGLAAWATSGSRKGMGQHQWAMARVNSATPSKDWASVKKSKAKKKK